MFSAFCVAAKDASGTTLRSPPCTILAAIGEQRTLISIHLKPHKGLPEVWFESVG
jgi:hypothetical protein